MSSVRETVAAILADKFRVHPQEMKPEDALAALDLDSLAVVELLFALQEELGVRIGEDEVTPRHTLQELVETLERKLEQQPPGEGR
ncbi:MAG TPA: acyl carrier protein [Streptomyces sp.]|nr:acyl carrier protein [Streptomyces sp.]